MFKKNGSNKIQFDLAGFYNLVIQVVVIMGMMFGFYLTAIEARFDENEKIDLKQTIIIEYILEDVREIKAEIVG